MTDEIFSDIDPSFFEHPVKRELSRKTNEAAVKASIKNLILTNFYERPFQPNIGCGVRGLLFELPSPVIQRAIEESIKTVIQNYERTRVHLIDIRVVPDVSNDAYRITILFSILNSPNQITLPIILKRVR